MGTKFASYTLKLASLHEYYQRLVYLTPPVPAGADMAITLKYFSQSLLSLLKDVENSPYDMLKLQNFDHERMALYPNLDYKQLYNALSQLIDVIPAVHSGLYVFGKGLLQCLTCLLPFLENDLIENLPYLVASSIAVLPKELHQDIVNNLCFYILPFTITRRTHGESENYASQSISAVLMMILEYSRNSAHHCQLLECLMTYKSGIIKDLLCVIAYGTIYARASATKLLFYYWPAFNPNLFDRKSVLMKFSNDFLPFSCQRDDCPNSGNAEATKVCFSHSISILYAADLPPPLYLCIECANEIHKDNPNQAFNDILHPMQQISLVCENKNCRALEKSAVSVCFSIECASYNSNHPIRYCQQCHNIRHNNRRGNDHIFHLALHHISCMDSQMKTYFVQAIISLLKEAESTDSYISLNMKDNATTGQIYDSENKFSNNESTSLEERQLLGRYGIWLLIGLCSPDQDVPKEILGRMLSMLFHWFHITAYSFDDTKKRLMHLIFSVGQAESTLEKLKTDYVCKWLFNVMNTYHDIFISCLLPYPTDYVRVGGHWEMLAPLTSHLKDGLNRLFCLVPYEIITPEIWNYVMPYWMEAITNDISLIELQDLRITLSKILDADMSPLGFDTQKLYTFVADRFINTNSKIQEQAISWLQALTMLEITIPISHLLLMFKNSVCEDQGIISEKDTRFKEGTTDAKNYQGPAIRHIDDKTADKSEYLSDEDIPVLKDFRLTTRDEMNLSCCILMLDVLLKQMELQNIDRHCGVSSWICKEVCSLLKSIEVGYWNRRHYCGKTNECSFCEATIIWHQLSLQIITYLMPEKLANPPDDAIDDFIEDFGRKNSFDATKRHDNKSDDVMNMPIPELHSVGGVLVHMPHFFEQIMTATVETVSEQLDLAAIIPTERIIPAVARPATVIEGDIAATTLNIEQLNAVVGNGDIISETSEQRDHFWCTSKGKFQYSIDNLPAQLQYIYKLFQDLTSAQDSDISSYMLESLKMMCLHDDILNTAFEDHQEFFIWCQENVFIMTLWDLLNAEHSHLAQTAVPLLLHCVTLPHGIDTFWLIVQKGFHDLDWQIRFISVERVALIARFVNSTPIKNCIPLQTSLAQLFCYLINSMDDINTYVAQKATLYLCTIHDTAMKAFLMCLETQFDLSIIDRPLILQCLYQLHNCLGDRKILNWDFFLNRFDTLFLEAQVSIDKKEGINYFRDLKSSDFGSDALIKKLHRAEEALSYCDGNFIIKTIISSFGEKWPLKRKILNIPLKISKQTDTKQDLDIERTNSRQYSAPILKRKTSRFGLGQLIGYTLPNNSITDVHLPSFNMTDDGSLSSFMHKIIDLEETDAETVHLLIFLFMQFLSRQDQAYPSDEKYISKVQSIVIRHFYLLLGYDQTEKHFFLAPQKVRSSVIFTSFIMNLPQVLDQNHSMGLYLIQPFLVILQNVPCPYTKINSSNNYFPIYSLWAIKSVYRRAWLISVLVILYKFEYSQQKWFDHLQVLIRIVLHTLERHYHICNHLPSAIITPQLPSYRRDQSPIRNGHEIETILSVYNIEGHSYQSSISVTNTKNDNNLLFNNRTFLKHKQNNRNQVDRTNRPVIDESLTDINTMHFDSAEIGPSVKPSLITEEKYVVTSQTEKMKLKNIDYIHLESDQKLESHDIKVSIDMPVIERLLPIGKNSRCTANCIEQKSDISSISRTEESLNTSRLQLPLFERLLPVGPNKDELVIITSDSQQSAGSSDHLMVPYPFHHRILFKKDVGHITRLSENVNSKDKSITSVPIERKVVDQKTSSSNTVRNYYINKDISGRWIKQNTVDSLSLVEDSKDSNILFELRGYSKLKKEYESEHIISEELKITRSDDGNGREKGISCSECGLSKEEYSDEEVGLFIIVLGTFVHREACLAAPFIPEILKIITKVSSSIMYPWQCELSMHLPGGALSVARQFMRCILHQMAPNGIFIQIFHTNIKGTICHRFFKSVVQALIDFNELNPIAPLQILLESLIAKKNLPNENLTTILSNISNYLECLPLEAGLGSGTSTWSGLLIQFEGLFRRLVIVLPALNNFTPLLKIMISILKVPGMQPPKGILDPFSKVLSYAIQNSIVHFASLIELCYLCYRNFTKDRDKHFLSRVIVYELTLALKFKTMIPDSNFLLLLQFILD
ncbi:protein unc-79 homolog, partial [Phymastichus coffea]|uniref:protein unc-79 homolog n=1 Tax=Phymastichus coffea TaxID=108790 RepID=UPI00273BE61D